MAVAEKETDTLPPLVSIYQSLYQRHAPSQQLFAMLEDMAGQCLSILELGAHRSIITWALLHGLCTRSHERNMRRYILNDLKPFNVNNLLRVTESYGVQMEFYWQNDLTLDLTEAVDMIVIDTLHVYPHLRLELEKFAPFARRFLAILNTAKYGDQGESIMSKEMQGVCATYGYTEECMSKGMMPAILEFLETDHAWSIHEVSHQGNGLVVMMKN